MDKEAIIIIMLALIEITAIISFTCLACHFGHWWIALFSILFALSYKATGK